MRYEVHAKTNDGWDIDIIIEAKTLDDALKIAKEQRTPDNCYVWVLELSDNPKVKHYLPLYKWTRCNWKGINNWHKRKDTDIFVILGKHLQFDKVTGEPC
ncbi:hypothetical protein R4575_16820 [Acinetobacter baumannii]|nr:hypothetical protein [Acinetobacter baumannii]